MHSRDLLWACFLVHALLMLTAIPAGAELHLGSEELVTSGGVDIAVTGYSVPSVVDLNGDGLKDLIVGEGGILDPGKVRIYANTGTPGAPAFSGFAYAQSEGADLSVPASGCLGAFPRAAYWDNDGLMDLIVGLADGTVKAYLNVGTQESPAFDGGYFIQVGETGLKVDIDVGYRATPTVLDWNNDGLKDLVVGALDGKIHVYPNCGCSLTLPEYIYEFHAQADGSDLAVPSLRSSPHVQDLDGDGKKDLLTGNTNGQLLFYSNVVSDQIPGFSGYSLVESDGVPIDLPGTPRSRPFVCDWTGDGLLDVLIGAADGKVHLYQGARCPGDANEDWKVDGGDYTIWADNYGASGVPAWLDGGWAYGNFTDDDKVDGGDYTIWADNYGTGVVSIPEPAALSLLAVAGVSLIRRRRR